MPDHGVTADRAIAARAADRGALPNPDFVDALRFVLGSDS
jgi:hypothetical protein